MAPPEINVTVTEQPPIEVQITEPTGPPTIVEVPVPEVVEVEVSGPAGLTAYELAVEQGFSGTLQDWFDSLKGEQGDQGPIGTDLYYLHVQSAPSASEIITHGLSKFPSVSIKDSSGQAVEGDYTYIDLDTVQVDFSSAFSWDALFN